MRALRGGYALSLYKPEGLSLAANVPDSCTGYVLGVFSGVHEASGYLPKKSTLTRVHLGSSVRRVGPSFVHASVVALMPPRGSGA